jgi:hypothetical protein
VLAVPLFAGATLAGAIGSAAPAPTAPAAATTRAEGLSLTPSIVQLRPDRAATVTITNTAGHAMHVTIRIRPWLQAPDGTVAPDPHRTLTRLVHASPARVTLAAGSRRTIRLSMRRRPPGGSLFGALDVSGARREVLAFSRIAPRYRLIGSLRLNPSRVRTRLLARAPSVTKGAGLWEIVLPVRNLGNTVEPISGRVVITGPNGTHRNVLAPVRVAPRRQVAISLGTFPELPDGRYRLAITLRQAGRTVLHTTRHLRIT